MIKRRILVKHGVMIVLSVGLFTGTVFGQFNVSGYEQDQSQGTSTQVAQTAPAPQALALIPPQTMARSVMTNDNILRMVKSGLGDALIISVIKSEPGEYSTSPNELVNLKEAGVSESILGAMVVKTPLAASTGVAGSLLSIYPSGATPVPGLVAEGDPNDPLSTHDSGIWLYSKGPEGRSQMVLLERAAYEGSKTGGLAAYSFSYGIAKIKSKAVLPGRYASTRTNDPSVVFYFYFEHRAAGLDQSSFLAAISNPGQFSLVKLAEKKSTRETIIGTFGMWSGSSTGTDENSRVTFRSDKIRPGLYKVTLNGILPNGEYCFLALEANRSANIYDFGFGAAGDVSKQKRKKGNS